MNRLEWAAAAGIVYAIGVLVVWTGIRKGWWLQTDETWWQCQDCRHINPPVAGWCRNCGAADR